MSEQYPGGFITKAPPTPQGPYETDSAYGMWNLSQQAGYAAQGLWPTAGNAPRDAQFNYVSLLLHGDGTNGAQNNTFLDGSTNNFTITRNGNTTQGSFSPYGANWSNYFGETSTSLAGYLSMPTGTALDLTSGDFTVEAWVYITADISYAGIFSNSLTATPSFVLAIEAGSPYANTIHLRQGTPGSWAVNISANVQNNTWYHVAATCASNVFTLWINGTSAGSTTFSGTRATPASTSIIGRYYQDSGDYYYWGYISNLRVVKGTAVYTSTFTPPTAPLTAISGTSLLTCQSNSFVDNSASPLTITVNRTPNVQRFNPFGESTEYSTATYGGSGYFDGSGDYLSIPNASGNLGTGDFAISFWMYASADPTNAVIATNAYNQTSFTGGWAFQAADPSTLYFYCGAASGGIGGATKLLTGQWNYIEASRSGTTIRVFVNGVQLNSATNSSTGTSANATIVGARRDGTAAFFPGYITDFKVVIGTAGNTSTYTPPSAPVSTTSATLLLSMQNGAIYDNAMMNDLETVGNAQISTSVVKYGTGSLAFDGTGDYLTVPVTPQTSLGASYTIEAWVYLANTSGVKAIYSHSVTNVSQYGYLLFYVTGTSLAFYVRPATSGAEAGLVAGTLSATTWTHVAVSVDNNSCRLFINGVQVGSTTTVSATTYTPVYSTVGADIVQGYPMNGYIDDLRITNGYARYTTTFTPPTAAFPNTGPT